MLVSDTEHSSVGTTGQKVQYNAFNARTEMSKQKQRLLLKKKTKPATVLYTDINSLNLSLTDTIQTALKFIYKYQHLDCLKRYTTYLENAEHLTLSKQLTYPQSFLLRPKLLILSNTEVLSVLILNKQSYL